ncbi:hypothetical protein CCR75_002220 [Bremia lactucae]|uniref:U4/U6.U5 tri-snRNP-associated protein 1 n=1 Tax=Bremia lactucae TaxID=4779 RepID=A0A976FNQ8_BRELC|nr:hypothetical protein CCR75_002220 [Bremia lactucae]
MARSRSRSLTRSRRHKGSTSSSRRHQHAPASRHHHSRNHRDDLSSSVDDSKNGEISLSIDETNKLRLSLGLKPLVAGPSTKEHAVISVQKTRTQLNAEREQQELQTKLQQSKTRRELTQKVAGQSLGEQLQAQLIGQRDTLVPSHDALAWVKQSRLKQGLIIEAANDNTKHQHTYEAPALAGMTVSHSIDHFNEGNEVVLTLKDQHVLKNDGKALNDDEDELENVELREADRRVAQQTQAKRAVMPVYCAYDDDEFLELGSGRKRKILAQYDDIHDAAEADDARKFRLNAAGGSTGVVANARRDSDHGINEGVTLLLGKQKLSSPVTTTFLKKRKKNRKIDKRRHCDDTSMDTFQHASQLIAQLESDAGDASDSMDRGKREHYDSDRDDADETQKLFRFQEAREKANALASTALAASVQPQRMKPRVVNESDVLDDNVALERAIHASLARARDVKTTEMPIVTSEERIAEFVRRTVPCETTSLLDVERSHDTAKNGHVPACVGQVFRTAHNVSNPVVFNEATDFETRLREAMETRAAQFQETVKGRTVSREKHDETEANEAKIGIDARMCDTKEKEDDGMEKEVWGEEEPLVGTGMGATLALLRKTGDLRQTRVERQAGRANDVRDCAFEDDLRIKNGVKLDYRDEFGRLLTKKEAFRLLSYKFHGHEPGKKRKEKRLRQLKEELQAQKMLSGEGSMKMMKVLETKQKHTKEAHVVLSSGS